MDRVRAQVGGVRPLYQIMRRINTGADVRSVLDAVAEGVAQAVGFEVAAISYLTPDRALEITTVAGSHEAREALVGTRVPIEEMEAELGLAERWGPLLFIPAERFGDSPADGWIPEPSGATPVTPAGGDPDAERWRPEDTLRCPLLSAEGELLGMLSVDLPVDGLRPGPERRELLEMYGELAGIALSNARRAGDLEEQVRLAAEVDRVYGTVAPLRDVGAIVDASVSVVAEALGADRVWVRTFGEDGQAESGRLGRHPATAEQSDEPAVALVRGVAAGACRAWAAGVVRVARLGVDGTVALAETHAATGSDAGPVHRRDPGPSDRVPVAGGAAGWTRRRGTPHRPAAAEHADQVDYLSRSGARCVLMVPIGAGPGCLGYLVAARAESTRDWSDHEIDAAAHVARHLGQAILNARLLEREQVLVRQLEALDHYRNDLISTVSHELRTPLTSIAGHLELIEDDPTNAPEVSFRVVRRNLERVRGLIDDLLTLKRLATTDAPPGSGVVDLQQAALDAVDALRPRAAEQGVTLVTVPSGGPLLISGDRDELERVALSLVDNAVKYTPSGGTVTVSAEQRDRYVRLVCTDTGIGISRADQEELFSEFFRSTNPAALAVPGTGLGLSIVRRIVQRHGGSIRLESDLGRGSTFTVRLPLSSPSRS